MDGTEIIWKGVVTSTTSIGSLSRVAGASDTGNSIGDYVMLLPASDWANQLVAGLLVEHNQDGTHGAITSTNATLTTPKVVTSINDANGNEVIKTPATASAVNEITVTNAATGNAPTISATGDDTDIDLKLAAKGTNGRVLLGPNSLVGAEDSNGDTGVAIATTETDISGTSVTFTLKSASTILFSFSGQLRVDTAGNDAKLYLNVDGTSLTDRTKVVWARPAATATNLFPGARSFKYNLAAGSHTVKLVTVRIGAGTATLYGASWTGLLVSQ